jgi:glycerate 2-kinase
MLADRLTRIFRDAVALCDVERLTGASLVRDGDMLEVYRHAYVTAQASSGDATPRLSAQGSALGISLQGGRVAVIAVGKAAPGQARAMYAALSDRVDKGLLIVPDDMDAGVVPPGFELVRATHPLPGSGSVEAARKALALAGSLSKEDMLLCGISGGTSALLALPAEGLSLSDKEQTTRMLLRSGADIGEINAVRKHLSRVKGGQLAAATKASVLGLLLSDVAGDPPDVIGSGPVTPDPTTYGEAMKVLAKYALTEKVPSAVVAHLLAGSKGQVPETPKGARGAGGAPEGSAVAGGAPSERGKGDALGERCRTIVVAGPEHLRSATVALAAQAGFAGAGTEPPSAGQQAEALAKQIGALARLTRDRQDKRAANAKPQIFVYVREPSVAVSGEGQGGRNSHLALLVAREIAGVPGTAFLSAGSDGIDGDTKAAGAAVTGESWAAAEAKGLDPAGRLARFDSGPVHAGIGSAIVTGRTGVNFMDLHLLAVE